MAVDYSTTSLIAAVKRIACIPTSQKLFTDATLVGILNDELQSSLVPEIMSVREEYFVTYKEYIVPVHSEPFLIDIPSDAVGGKLREVAWVDSNQRLVKVARIDLEQSDGIQPDFLLAGFRIQDNSVVLAPSQGGTIRLYYFKRPNELVTISQAAKVVGISGNDIQIGSAIPTSWTVGEKLNTISLVQPFGVKASELTIMNVAFPIVTVDTVVDVEIGDWICLDGYSPIPQIPVEAHKVLAQMAAVKCLESMGDDKVSVAQAKANKLIESLFKMINPRIDASPKRIVGSGIADWMKNGSRKPW